MIYLTSILKSIEVYCASTVTTNQLDFIISYTEKIQGTYVSKTVTGTTNSASPVVMLPSSQVNSIIEISGISIINNDSSPNTITIRLVKTQGGYTTLKQVLLDVGEQMEYDGSQWHVMTSTGEIKTGSGGGGMVYPGVGIAVSTGASWDTSITDNSTNWDAAYSWVNTNGANAVTAYGWGNHASAGYLTGITSLQVTTALGYTPVTNARTLTINGTTYDLSANRSWTISAGTTYTFSTGLNDNAGTVTSNLSTGVSGGQSVIGGTASGNNLTLSSTSNATKGKIVFGTSAYDEVNNRLGIGNTAPSQKLQVQVNDTGLTFPIFVRNANASGATGIGFVNEANADWIKAGIVHQRAGGYGVGTIHFLNNGVESGTTTTLSDARMSITSTGNVGIGQSSPTAALHLKAGTATANTAPLKFTSGTNLTTAEAGAFEYNNTFHVTNSDATRRHVVTAPNTTKVTAAAPYTNDGYITVNIGGTDFKLMTTA